METIDFTFDITNVKVDVTLDREKRLKKFIEENNCFNYNKKIKINNTTVYLNFLTDDKLSSKSILKVIS